MSVNIEVFFSLISVPVCLYFGFKLQQVAAGLGALALNLAILSKCEQKNSENGFMNIYCGEESFFTSSSL